MSYFLEPAYTEPSVCLGLNSDLTPVI